MSGVDSVFVSSISRMVKLELSVQNEILPSQVIICAVFIILFGQVCFVYNHNTLELHFIMQVVYLRQALGIN